MLHKVLSVYAIQSDTGRYRGHLIMWNDEIPYPIEKCLKTTHRRFRDEGKPIEQMFHKVTEHDKDVKQ